MKNVKEIKKIYRVLLDLIDSEKKTHEELILGCAVSLGLTDTEISDTSTNSPAEVLRSLTGKVINEMTARGVIAQDENKLYYKVTEKPTALRIERCEEEILRLLSSGPKTKKEIRDTLTDFFGTEKTSTKKDDNQLFTYIGQILKKLTSELLVSQEAGVYRIRPARAAEVKNREDVAALRADFLTLLHRRGGEYFEHYFMNLLARYYQKHGKRVYESMRTGGADDGGIDGIARIEDSLGFRETVMVQTKNRIEYSSETDVRGFYGAVCAAQGSRGIFATTSDFYSSAKTFLDKIDNCIGVNGTKLFDMAVDASYGIKKTRGGRLVIDPDII